MRSTSIPTLSKGPTPSHPLSNLHSKQQVEAPCRSKINTMNNVVRALSSSKVLQQALGTQDPEPFVAPPAMPQDLRERFEDGLRDHEQIFAADFFESTTRTDGFRILRSLSDGKATLADILEEKESPTRSNSTRTSSGDCLKVHVSKRSSTKQAVVMDQQYTLLDMSEAANDTGGEYTDCEFDSEDHSSWRYDSSTTLAMSDYSRSVSSESSDVVSAPPAQLFPPRTSSLLPHHREQILPCVPQDAVKSYTSEKVQSPRKRTPSSSVSNGFDAPLSQCARQDDTAGLPVLPADVEALWKFKFPGNTYALLTILVAWSHAIWIFYRRLPDPKLFAIHPAFPYSLAPPLKKKLLSVSFYDTSTEPHTEIRFLGPGDVAEISYHEVEVFSDFDGSPHKQATVRSSFPIGIFKQTFGLANTESSTNIRYMSMAQRAKTGQGRWCYILLKGHQTSDGGTPPHLILAWHISAVTVSSDCLHTIYPRNNKPNPTVAKRSTLKRFSSLQNFGTALLNPTRLKLHQSLRSASSSSELAPVDGNIEIEQCGGTLHRTVLKMERAGNIPLLEGFRVDVSSFRGWLDACGKGNGKVIMWRERDER